MKHVIAVFDGIDDGLRAVAALEREDLPLSRISILARGAHADLPSSAVLLAFEEMSVLGTGAAMVTGPLAAVMRAAATSNPEIDLTATLVETGMQPHQAVRYEWAVRHGKTLVLTTVGTAKAERVARVLSLCRPIERVSAA